MSASYARLPDAGDDLGRSVVGRRKWSFADCACAHGRQIDRGSMYTDQHTNRGGNKAENSVALRTVLRHCQILPQRREGLRRRDSARRGEQSDPKSASSRECSSTARCEKQQCCGFDNHCRKRAAEKQAGGKRYGPAASGNCAERAHHKQRDCDAFTPGWSRNRQSRRNPGCVVSTLRCSTNSNQKASKRKASWHGKETYATQMARTGALAQ